MGKTKDGRLNVRSIWLTWWRRPKKSRILKAVDGDKKLADKITKSAGKKSGRRVLIKVDSTGKG
ncbi:hypothetical protein ACT7DA_15440 [Bacillus pacificus]